MSSVCCLGLDILMTDVSEKWGFESSSGFRNSEEKKVRKDVIGSLTHRYSPDPDQEGKEIK